MTPQEQAFDAMRKALKWALSNINCEPYEWSDEENADAHKAAIAALSAAKTVSDMGIPITEPFVVGGPHVREKMLNDILPKYLYSPVSKVQPQAQGEAVDYDYQATFNAIAKAAKPSANGLAISVKKFWESYRASAHPQATEPAWMPIETAPKDGTAILLFGDGRVTSGNWSEPSEIPRLIYRDGFAPEEEWDEWEPYWASWDGGFTEEHPATHWMPLPAAPTTGGQQP